MRIAWILAAAILIYGTYYEAAAAALSCVLFVLILQRIRKENKLMIAKSLFLWAIMLLPVAALISIPFAIDRGMAGLGFIKVLPAALFCLVLSFEDQKTKETCMEMIPLTAVLITAVGILSKLTPYRDLFYIQNRLSGNFQYANSYALFLLIAVIILLYSSRNIWVRAGMILFLLYGIWETGSRSVGVLALAAFMVWSLSLTGKKKLVVLTVPTCLLILTAVGGLTGNRWGDFNLLSSSFVSRLFYHFDGIKMVLSHPLGLGYKGFLFYQGAVQSANYSATYAHNELLQAALDFGWIPAALLLAGGCIALFKKGISLRNRSLIAVIFVHSLFDWDMQFTSLLMILILLIEQDAEVKDVPVTCGVKKAVAAASTLVIVVCLWIGTASFFEHTGAYAAAATIYPGLTTSQMHLIDEASDSPRYKLAESICSRNDYCVIALQAMAEKSLNGGNIAEAEKYAFMAMKAGRYNSKGYEFYIQLMDYALNLLKEAGHEEGMYAVLMRIAGVPAQMEEVRATTGPYADFLYNKPEIRLDDEYMKCLQRVEEILERNESNE